MTAQRDLWVVVLAAGDGTRLSEFTTNARGERVPKQYCSLDGRVTLLHTALQRARQIAANEQVCAIVAESHWRFWRASLSALPRGNVIVQPSNRGTANGVLLSVLSILRRDPPACILFLPADHHVCDEPQLARAMRQAFHTLASDAGTLALIGIEPDEPDPELGYILPGKRLQDGSRLVKEFIEKPAPSHAQELIAAGALWNSLIFSAGGRELLERLRQHMGWIVNEMTAALARDVRGVSRAAALSELYQVLPCLDFSRTILQRAASSLRVITAPHCGWCDLGTAKRVAAALTRLQQESVPLAARDAALCGFTSPIPQIRFATHTAHPGARRSGAHS
jgi:mannose-1-phosphate guanylyltransferase